MFRHYKGDNETVEDNNDLLNKNYVLTKFNQVNILLFGKSWKVNVSN